MSRQIFAAASKRAIMTDESDASLTPASCTPSRPARMSVVGGIRRRHGRCWRSATARSSFADTRRRASQAIAGRRHSSSRARDGKRPRHRRRRRAGRRDRRRTARPRSLGDESGHWIDAVALRAGRRHRLVRRQDGDARATTRAACAAGRRHRRAQGLAFAPKGYRLAITHYNGVTLWFPNTEATPELLDWKGSHLDVTWSPDGRFVRHLDAGERAAWLAARRQGGHAHDRLSRQDALASPGRMTGSGWRRPARTPRSSGRSQSKDGPMGKAPRECGVRPAKVTRVAFHPSALVLAVGYEDGCILLCRLTDASELLVRGATPSTARSRPSPGTSRASASPSAREGGAAGLLTLPALSRAHGASPACSRASSRPAGSGERRARQGVGPGGPRPGRGRRCLP